MDETHMVDRECRVEKAPGAMLEILLSYSDRRRTELKPVNVELSMQVIWLLRSILELHIQRINIFIFEIYWKHIFFLKYVLNILSQTLKPYSFTRKRLSHSMCLLKHVVLFKRNTNGQISQKLKPVPAMQQWQDLLYDIRLWHTVMWHQAN